MSPLRMVAVVGSGRADEALWDHAREVGGAIARSGFGLVCGGLGGVMEAACRGAHDHLGSGSGRIIGILPGTDPHDANSWVDVAIPTGSGNARNVVIVLSAAVVVAVGGESGTLSEIAHAWKLGRPIGAYVPAGGWGARLANERLDTTRSDRIEAIRDVPALELWLQTVLS